MLVFGMDEGFILSNKYRRTIFDGLASGETDIERIAKKHRIILVVARKVADDFINGGLLEKKGNRFVLTKEGEKIAANIRG
jgi:predicted transcriptional regulator